MRPVQENILFKKLRTAKNALESAYGGVSVPRKVEAAKSALQAILPILTRKLTEWEASAEEVRGEMAALGMTESEYLSSALRGITARAVEAGAVTAADVAKALDITAGCARMRLRRAVAAHLVDRITHGRYRAPGAVEHREANGAM